MTRKINIELKKTILEKQLTQRSLARAIGMHEATLSLIVCGVYNPSNEQQEKIARILDKNKEILFPDRCPI